MAAVYPTLPIAAPLLVGDQGGPRASADQRLSERNADEQARRHAEKPLEGTGNAIPKTEHYRGPSYAKPAVATEDVFDYSDQFREDNSDGDEEGDDIEAAARENEREIQEEDAADMKLRAQMEDEAYQAALVTSKRLNVPPEIAKIHEANTWVLRRAWIQGLDPSLVNLCKQANSEIASINSKANPKRKAGKFRFPGESIMQQICVVHDACEGWHAVQDLSLDAKETRNSFAMVIANSILTLKNIIEPLGLSWRTFVTAEAATSLTTVLAGSMGSMEKGVRSALQKYLTDDALTATQSQESLMQQMAPVIAQQISLGGKGELAEGYGAAVEYNKQMAQLNASLGFKESDHALDLEMIQAIITFGSDVQTRNAKIMEFACWLYNTGQTTLALGLHDQKDLARAHLSDALGTKIQATKMGYQCPVDGFKDSALVEQMQRQLGPPERLMIQPMPKNPTHQPPQRADDSVLEKMQRQLESHLIEPAPKNPANQPPQQADDVEMEDTDPSLLAQNLNSMKARSTVHDPMPGGLRRSSVKAPAFHGRVTPLGMVCSVQKWSFGYRMILNICTEEFPIYQSVPGSELGRGSAQDLYAKYPAPPSSVKDRRKKHVLELKAIIELPQKASVGRTPTTKFLVVWNNEEKRFNSSPTEEWVSRSDLTSIYGKTDTERARKCLLDDLKFNRSHLDAMKEQGRHPVTGRLLDEDDWTHTPWLCDPSGNPKSADAQTAITEGSRGRKAFGPGRLGVIPKDGHALGPKQGVDWNRSLTTSARGAPNGERRGQSGSGQKGFGKDTRGTADFSRGNGGVSYPEMMDMDTDLYG
ncbi:hypothetical protein B0A54_17807 [Friedmanniomyces endolithicus]|uniref:Uncharacterized protein n=1 Tax=Friedmanniomyces endolithicus TaxID=329885 RepID=A0A4U0TPT9_9PEZI|nr:hypothetical protein LTS09_017149 [Friedmanniomyces endolithicus]TKA23997.1 hypothetical protein B0A54_17807 [Friedmanniomyces endolithicus]